MLGWSYVVTPGYWISTGWQISEDSIDITFTGVISSSRAVQAFCHGVEPMICFHISDRFVHTNQTIRNVGISDRLFLVENIIFVPISVRTSQFLSWKIEKDSSS